MFIIREYAVCVLVVCMLGMVLFALWGVGYLLKTTGARFRRLLQVAERRPGLKLGAMKFSSNDVMDSGTESSVVADYSS